ncbi:DUF4136 domain-containing protein [Acidovorax radicis]|uniref:DUF4136 domain-containing protein n=1 Tax=Acidovorax radicis TaxID=758826 RepID=UPI001CF95FDB|nr:DUF4136 domain-containing protein [Acidovorax radicis]UCU99779.1 DUF4136 domain-containing protein [Acidovorax radicis]
MTRRWIFSLSLCAAAALAGCSTGPRIVEGQVQSFSTLAAVPAPATYRLDRLPSQQVPAFDPIAALAEQALARVGLQRDDAAPRFLVQIGVQAGVVPRYDGMAPYGPSGPWGFGGWGGWHGRGGWGFGGNWGFYEPSPLHRRAVSLMLRDAATQAVVYETSAVHEDIWVSDPAVYGVLFDAALTGFPKPPQGPREVRLPLPMLAPQATPAPVARPAP